MTAQLPADMACPSDNSFGPTVGGCRDDFDFTVLFEQTVFTLTPSCFFILLSLPALVVKVRAPVVVQAAWLLRLKLIFTLTHAALRLSIVVLDSSGAFQAIDNKAISSSAATASLFAALCLVPYSYISNSRSLRPSHIIGLYLVVTVLLDVASARTASLMPPSTVRPAYGRLLIAATCIKFILLILESWQKSRWILLDAKTICPEARSSLLSLGVFGWLYSLFLNGYRGLLCLDTLYVLDKDMECEKLWQNFQLVLVKHPTRGKCYGLARALVRTLYIYMMLPVVPRLVLLGASFCQPFLIDALLSFLQQDVRDKSHGYGLIFATMLMYLTMATSETLYWYLQERFVARVRGCLVQATYFKTTNLPSSVSEDASVLTLMSTDVERVLIGILSLHEFWANMIQAGISCWLLQKTLGTVFVAPVIVVLGSTGLVLLASKLITPRQRAWMEAIQARVGVTADTIGQMKNIKMAGMARPVEKSIQALRDKEIGIGGRWRIMMVFCSTLAQAPMILSPIVTLALTSKTLNTITVFVSTSYIMMLASPLQVMLQRIPQLANGLTCLERIQHFLERDDRNDMRTSGHQEIEERRLQTIPSDEQVPMATIAPLADDMIVSNGAFGWVEDAPLLRNVNLVIPKGKLTIISGPVGSGKSTLCKALLGEILFAGGQVKIPGNGSIAYCDQQPVLTNSTVQDNIIGFSKFDELRYQRVLQVTMLNTDLLAMPLGDQTVVGSKGISLSGGQKQRLSIARAIYATGINRLLIDDSLSGLDATTAEYVFNHVFGPNGFTTSEGKTVIVCTHNQKFTAFAHSLIELDSDGNVSQISRTPRLTSPTTSITSQSDSPPPGKVPGPSEVPLAMATTTPSAADRARRTGDRTVYKYYFSCIGKFPLAAFFICGICFGFLDNFPRVWLTLWTQDLDESHGPSHTQGYYIDIYGMLQLLGWITVFMVSLVALTTFTRQGGSKLHRQTLSSIINATLPLFTKTDIGILINYFSQDMTFVDAQLPSAMINIILDLTSIIGMAALLASSSPWLALTYPALYGILWFVQDFYLRTSRQLRLLDLEAKSPLYANYLSTLNGVATIRAFGWVQDSLKYNAQLVDRSQRARYQLAMIQRWLHLTLSLIVAVTATCLVALMTRLGAGAAISGASLVTLMRLSQSLVDLVTFYASLETSIGAVARLRAFSQNTETEPVPESNTVTPPSWPQRGVIDIQNIWASYDSSGSDYCLERLHVNIAAGEKVALCGRTGSGKSSFLLLLLALLDPLDRPNESSGVTIDGQDITKMDRQVLRERLITIPQDPIFLPPGSTAAENIDPLNTATREQCEEVISLVGLSSAVEGFGGCASDSFRSSALSYGQRQLFSLARAVLKKRLNGTSLLLLDEFTSSVDSETERKMMNIIMQEFANDTIIMVSHRLDVVTELFDRVLASANDKE
ncbi:hypothetical protein VHEMI07252 [[Torrubiella] hemipterigena]|uniref:ABC transporter n=1 Tax=[Torrubiella] hemipterigena TaxID=1531966 RepID=A0A0A1TL13_9HYPO|nr:hypothetical protein VHEMI07252 [[Torrubiella] hemipterigena]